MVSAISHTRGRLIVYSLQGGWGVGGGGGGTGGGYGGIRTPLPTTPHVGTSGLCDAPQWHHAPLGEASCERSTRGPAGETVPQTTPPGPHGAGGGGEGGG
jgi:hypothetical protein